MAGTHQRVCIVLIKIMNLFDEIFRQDINWILGFGAEHSLAEKLEHSLYKFVELVFLRETNADGKIPASLGRNAYKPAKNCFLDSVIHSLCTRQLLNYSSVVVVQPRNGYAVVQELVFSSMYDAWGCNLPACPNCGNQNVRAVENGPSSVVVKCGSCLLRTKGQGIRRPKELVAVNGYSLASNRYFWKPLNMQSLWDNHEWIQGR